MILEEYKAKIRLYRGHLKGCDKELYEIYHNGCKQFKELSLSNKLMGVKKMAFIAKLLSQEEQREFVVWLLESNRNKNQIDLKIFDYIGESK